MPVGTLSPNGRSYAASIALLAREDESGRLEYVGGAMITLPEKAGRRAINAAAEIPKPPIAGLRRARATWLKPDLRLKVRHLRGGGELRHAIVTGLVDQR